MRRLSFGINGPERISSGTLREEFVTMSQLIGDQTQSITRQDITFQSGQDLSFPRLR